MVALRADQLGIKKMGLLTSSNLTPLLLPYDLVQIRSVQLY
jgi:hypothetical protein